MAFEKPSIQPNESELEEVIENKEGIIDTLLKEWEESSPDMELVTSIDQAALYDEEAAELKRRWDTNFDGEDATDLLGRAGAFAYSEDLRSIEDGEYKTMQVALGKLIDDTKKWKEEAEKFLNK